MSDIMRPMPFAQLMDWALTEYHTKGSIFGVSKLVRRGDGRALPIFGEQIETPFGPAADPHTQLAQNIIATYLITEKGLNTYIKCNPTLLGYEFARKTLDGLGYDYIAFDDHHFKEDLQWADAVPMFRRLQELCDGKGLAFGVKITNTFPVDVAANELPSNEMYMSGRSLYPLSLSLAGMLAKEFGGKLRISYSGGADAASIRGLFDAGIWPVTMATTVLKPGGYQRFSQIAGLLADIGYGPWQGVDEARVAALVEAIPGDGHWRKPVKPIPSRKTDKKVPLMDCFQAPCRESCPIHQDIPAYLMAVNAGKYEEALDIITRRNPLPFITGTICSHRCQDKCMRNAYDESVYIRGQKLKAAKGGFTSLLPKLKPGASVSGKKAAVVGGGPAGMAAAFFLGWAGVDVTLFEAKDSLGGIVRHVIPEFRIPHEAIDNDVRLMEAMGVKVRLNTRIGDLQALRGQFGHVIVATGAWQHGSAGLEYGEEFNVLSFLEAAKKAPNTLKLGENVVVIGGGNTAMDAARAAKRIPGVKRVSLVYRRTKRYMPADQEELELALADGVEFRELLSPVGVRDGTLTCRVMELGAPDASGRRSPVDTGKTVEVPAGTVIAAVGEKVDTALYAANGLEVDSRGRAVVNWEIMESSVKGIYVVGDGQTGPATVVEAVAGAMKAAQAIQDFDTDAFADRNVNPDYAAPLSRRGEVCTDCASCDEIRCLGCATVCETCTEVCPNRANVAVRVEGMRQRQIIHVDGMCNECGNCAVFCPYDSAPYKDKFTLFWRREDFENSENQGFLRLDGDKTLVRLGGEVREYDVSDPACGLYNPLRKLICAVYENYSYLLG